MKRDVVVAVAYGVVSVIVGYILIRHEVARRGQNPVLREEVEVATPAAGGGHSAVPGGGPEGRLVEGGFGFEMEVGPEGLGPVRVAPGSGEGTGEGKGPGSRGEGVEGHGNAGSDRIGRARLRLPERGSELLALGDSSIQAVADLLSEAGTTGPVLEFALRGVYGHVERMAMFKMLAAVDLANALELERQTLKSGPSESPDIPSLRWRVNAWPSRSREYAAYLRRDLETRLGITDETVAQRLEGIADQLAGRQIRLNSSEEPAPVVPEP